jgi:outer membrane protein OmpA-like peptidoglycan-associated protein
MPSLLDFSNSSSFRKKILVKNLAPYLKAPNRPTQPIDIPYNQSNYSVQDSPDKLIDEPSFANKLYPLNQYGAEGGYKQAPDPTGLLNNKSNEGEYGIQDADVINQSLIEQKKWKPLNVYSNGNQVQLDAADFINSLDKPIVYSNTQNNQPYPSTFVPSSYRPVSILLSNDAQGDNGLLSQDSYIQRLGAQTLRKEFEERIAQQIRQDTIGRANVLNVTSGTDAVNILAGIVPILEPNYTITVTQNPILAATNFALRLAGSVSPVSTIPGSYWDPNINPPNSTTLQQIGNAFRRSNVGNFINNLLGGTKTGSQIMFDNMGAGQKSRLFVNIDYNKYKPDFPRNIFDRVGGQLFGTQSNNSNYYIGSITSEPSRVFSPSGALPNDEFGREIQAPVFGPSELAQSYEGPDKGIKLGANGPSYSNGGGIEGGFTWVSPKYKGNAGKKVGYGGSVIEQEQNFKQSSYDSTESTNINFKEGSILDETQRLINSQPQGGKRLQHVGNAIDQVSKVFNDGYKELTKGSKVYKYIGDAGKEVGTEYCRVFTKDTPYLQYNNLQKINGITTSGRKFSDSVLDNTYNLNIVPNKQEGGQSSTNIIGTINNSYAKKYMFSIENLAWRTSSTPGYSVSDLAVCERGPNGGRVMWFPPYGLTFSENITPSFNPVDFLGRPEPIYTYKSTQRSGSLTWKIVVDHPSVLNLIVNKVLLKETNKTRINSIIDSFFAGCRKYDLYELAKTYYTINPNDLYQLQEAITSKEMTKEQIEYSKQTIQTGYNTPNGQSTDVSPSGGVAINFESYNNLGFYFGNDYPKQNQINSYSVEYTTYLSEKNQYETKPTANETISFFNNIVTPNYEKSKELINNLVKQLENTNSGTITITINSSCSAPAKKDYNIQLSKRRVESVKKYFSEDIRLKKYIGERLLIKEGDIEGEDSTVKVYDPVTKNFIENGKTVNCTDNDSSAIGGDTQKITKVYNTTAMACRRAYIKNIDNKTSSTIVPQKPEPQPQYTDVVVGNVVTKTVKSEEVSREWKPRDNITKRILRLLLSECDYFETIKETTPMVFDNLMDKLKYFHPAFHSMTPEGLNTRLTFLQQCMRPGDTIPVIREIGQTQTLKYNDAINTAFGAPPVLVLRIGDFFNTKIIPTGLQIAYEDLDLNPEGIGVQPMIANVTLSFNFVGGSGLKESVDKLQNALTFNYYANTEIYDDRADVTAQEESLKNLDKEFLAKSPPPGAPALNQAEVNNGQDNNNTIGTKLSSDINELGFEVGKISYSDFMDNFVKQTQTYFQNVVNKNKEVVAQYNNAVRQQWMVERNYTNGNFKLFVGPYNVTLFGKPNNIENRFINIFNLMKKDIEDNNELFIKYILNPKLQLSERVIKTIKNNYITFLNNKLGSFQNDLTKIIQDFIVIQQSYVKSIGKSNILSYSYINLDMSYVGTDGLEQPNGNVIIYEISGTEDIDPSSEGVSDTIEEMYTDIDTIANDVLTFTEITSEETSFNVDGQTYSGILVFPTEQGKYVNLKTDSVFNPFSLKPEFEDVSFRKTYMIVSNDIVDDKKYENFKQQIIGNIINNKDITKGGRDDISFIFDEYWKDKAKPLFVEENMLTKQFIENMEKTELKNFLNYSPFPKKKRVCDYTNESSLSEEIKGIQKKLIKSLNFTTNINTNVKTWNDNIENSNNAFVSKAKFN